MTAWDRQPAEPALWFGRFDAYRQAGPGRSLAAVYRQVGGQLGAVPSVWYDNFERWQWRDRAGAWDVAEQAEREQAERERIDRARQERITVLKAVRAKALAELQGMKVEDAGWSRVIRTLTTVTGQLRTEGA